MLSLRRVAFSLIPLILLCAGLETGAALLARVSTRVELPPTQLDRPLPNRATVGQSPGRLIACLGDSWTFGVGVRQEEAWPEQLRALLPKSPPQHPVNLGEPGATPLRAARVLTHWMRKSDPDLIVLLIGANPDPVESAEAGVTHNPLLRMRPLLHHLASYKLLVQVIARAQVRGESLLADETYAQRQPMQRGPGAEGSVPLDQERSYAERARDIRDNVARIDSLATAAGAELLLLTYAVPTGEQEPPRAGHRDANKALRVTAKELGRPILDLEDLYTQHQVNADDMLNDPNRLPGQPYSDLHPNAKGYQLYAQAVAAWILANP